MRNSERCFNSATRTRSSAKNVPLVDSRSRRRMTSSLISMAQCQREISLSLMAMSASARPSTTRGFSHGIDKPAGRARDHGKRDAFSRGQAQVSSLHRPRPRPAWARPRFAQTAAREKEPGSRPDSAQFPPSCSSRTSHNEIARGNDPPAARLGGSAGRHNSNMLLSSDTAVPHLI